MASPDSSVVKSVIGKKMPLRKRMILLVVALVVLAGVVIYRLSSASTWWSSKHMSGSWNVTTTPLYITGMVVHPTTGKTYRTCFRGYSGGTGTGSTTTVDIEMWVVKRNADKLPISSTLSRKTYNTSSELHCSATYKATSSDYSFYPIITKRSGPNLKVTAVSIDELRY